MSTYKVIQDVEAEDKLVGPLTLRQFIYAGIAAVSGYLGFLLASKGAAFMLVIFVPITAMTGFFAFPWGKDQPTEVWALAKIRFFFKPRKRIWDQSGVKEMVTVTVPKKIVRQLTNGLDQDEVHSRLNALANTIDSRGWAIKDINVNLAQQAATADVSDRLVLASSLPQVVSDVDVQAADDILDEAANPIAHQFDNMINASSTAHHQQLVAQMQQPDAGQPQAATNSQPMQYTGAGAQAAADPGSQWFMNQPSNDPAPIGVPQAATPTAEEEALVEKFRQENASMSAAYGHMKTLKTPEELMAEDAARQAVAAAAKPAVTPQSQAAIINLAQNDDLDVATIARQAHKADEDNNNGEVVISLR